MAYIGLTIDSAYTAAVCGRSTAELHLTLAHIPVGSKTALQDEVPGAVIADLDLLWAYTAPQVLVLGDVERFGAVLVRKAYGLGLPGLRARVADLLDLHGVRYSKDYEPWAPHVSVGLNTPQWCWVKDIKNPVHIQAHSSRAVFAGLSGIVAHHWPLGGALRDPVSTDTLPGV